MGLDDAGCAYSPGAGVCERDLKSYDCLRFHFAPADALKSGSFPYWVKDSGEVPISAGRRVFQALLYFLSAVLFVYSCVFNEKICVLLLTYCYTVVSIVILMQNYT
jgi:hypothetical protein